MARRIYKYEVPFHHERAPGVTMPLGADLLSVGVQNGKVMAWALVDEALEDHIRRLAVFGTGREVPSEYRRHVGTCQDHDRGLVWHVFEAP